ncbi:hypothetical protein OSTOST_01881 [Ostertagia ostertagi]
MKRSALVAASSIASPTTCPVNASTATATQATDARPFQEIPGPNLFARLFGKNRSLFRSKRSIANYFEWLVDLHKRYGPLVKEDARQVFASDGRQALHCTAPRDNATLSSDERNEPRAWKPVPIFS